MVALTIVDRWCDGRSRAGAGVCRYRLVETHRLGDLERESRQPGGLGERADERGGGMFGGRWYGEKSWALIFMSLTGATWPS